MSKLLCPLLAIPGDGAPFCLEHKCAWYDSYEGCCCIQYLAWPRTTPLF